MNRFSPFRWIKNVSIAKKLYFTVGIMAMLIVVELAALIFSINTLSSVRAYVNGEGLWSKAQKDAMYRLLRYSHTHDEADYRQYLEFMKISYGDRMTLIELNKKNPDPAIAMKGFIEGRNHPDDVEGMVNLFRRFNKVYYIHKAITAWTSADRLVAQFVPIGEKLHQDITSPHSPPDYIDQTFATIDPINTQLTIFEDEFSYTLGEGSRWLEYVIKRILFAIALTVECTGLILAITVSRGIQKGLNEILLSAQCVAKGDFKRKAKVFSRDEIGVLANNFNKMSAELEDTIQMNQQVQQKFRNLLESAPDAIVILNDKGIIQLVNAQTENMFSYPRMEIIGKNISILLPDNKNKIDANTQFSRFSENLANHKGEGFELSGKNKSGKEFPVELSIGPLETEEGLLFSAAIRDISEKKQLEKEIREINVNLEKKVNIRTTELERKNKELEQFAYVASHDLQEPLRTISSFVQLIRQKYQGKLDSDADKYIHYTVQSSDRMKTLIKDLLDYSRLGRETNLREIDCNTLLQEVVADLGKAIKDSEAEIIVGSLPVIYGYPTEIKQLFQNLISNSIKFRSQTVKPNILISAEKKEGKWEFLVSDNGIGIEEKYQEKIFIIFQRLHTRTEYEGSGIGLAHCKKIVELHDGSIGVRSIPGQGSVFHFTISQPDRL